MESKYNKRKTRSASDEIPQEQKKMKNTPLSSGSDQSKDPYESLLGNNRVTDEVRYHALKSSRTGQ